MWVENINAVTISHNLEFGAVDNHAIRLTSALLSSNIGDIVELWYDAIYSWFVSKALPRNA
jgi:hypothetical protein